ncbi:heme exporter protein CcmD [Chelatococcus reniformis]|uniref:Heme exporter protein D n=1 Tax=Chelatococcus reniformis TaxID=1494448 RepID=A0A916TXJ6_9HYPH|nr:heme exporter protein CcmD [Chelatococcus reniformis]GGC51056.1 hypothetical protein GCM10010994_07760 [Chelatococcus reniformis]
MSEAAHWAYVAAAYAAGLIIVGALVIHAVLDARAQRRTLARLEAPPPPRGARAGTPRTPASPTPAAGSTEARP